MAMPAANEWLKANQTDGHAPIFFANYCEKADGMTRCFMSWPPGHAEELAYQFPTRMIQSIDPAPDWDLTPKMKQMLAVQNQQTK